MDAWSARFKMPTLKKGPCVPIYVQAFPFDKKANAMGISSSNAVEIVVGF